MIVELAGIPGSGKSTAAGQLARGLRRAGIRTESPTRAVTAMRGPLRAAVKAAYAARFLLLRPPAALRMLAAVHASAQRSACDEASVGLNALLIASILHRKRGARRRSDRLVLLDQGGVQALASVMMSARAAVRVRRSFWDPLFAADRCLVLRLEAAEAVRRLALRPGRLSRVEAGAADARAAALQRVERDIMEIVRALEARGGPVCMHVGQRTIERLAADPAALVR